MASRVLDATEQKINESFPNTANMAEKHKHSTKKSQDFYKRNS